MPTLLIGDIGGTNARFALATSGEVGYANEITFKCADFVSPEKAIRKYLGDVGAPTPDVICLAVAGPIVDAAVKFTNNNWQIAARNLLSTFGTPQVRLLNDFEAIAFSIPEVSGRHTIQLGGPKAQDLGTGEFNVAVLGPGTGLGAAGLLCRGHRLIALVTEAGHVGFAPETRAQDKLLGVMRQRYERVSNERLLSGMGIENIYWALGQISGASPPPVSAAEVFEHAGKGEDVTAVQSVALFFELLGQVAGNLALSLGAFDGVYIAGGIVQRHWRELLESRFREGFENKGRHRSLLQRIPTLLVQHPNPGLLGAASVASRMADGES
jgi:glucokinase